jgi:rhamnosyltransferase
MFMHKDVFSIVVTFNSDFQRLSASLEILAKQCSVVVVDNSTIHSSREKIAFFCDSLRLMYIPLFDNCGVAMAQNIGVDAARKKGGVDILLMDDDSLPNATLVADLLDARRSSKADLVVVSARTVSECGEDLSNSRSNGSNGLTPCGDLTSSGSLISLAVFDLVGSFDEKLFIDCVDFEWGWRAKAKGVVLYLCDQVAIRHRLGVGSRFGFRIPGPIRHYYQYRNILKMIFKSKATLRWRFGQLIKLPVKIILIILLADSRSARLKYVYWGVFDYLTNRFGKFSH